MTGWTAEEVAAHLQRAGLVGEHLDLHEIAGDLTERSRLADELDVLLSGPPPTVVLTTWDPRWQG